MPYFRMGVHTIIGAGRFHFRGRDGIGWFPPAMAARQFVAGLFSRFFPGVRPSAGRPCGRPALGFARRPGGAGARMSIQSNDSSRSLRSA